MQKNSYKYWCKCKVVIITDVTRYVVIFSVPTTTIGFKVIAIIPLKQTKTLKKIHTGYHMIAIEIQQVGLSASEVQVYIFIL